MYKTHTVLINTVHIVTVVMCYGIVLVSCCFLSFPCDSGSPFVCASDIALMNYRYWLYNKLWIELNEMM